MNEGLKQTPKRAEHDLTDPTRLLPESRPGPHRSAENRTKSGGIDLIAEYRCLIGDRGYDSDGLDDLLMTQYGIEMIAANRRGRAKTQDGRPLRRAKRRWTIERLFAWLHNCRRVVTRWERHVGNYLGMVQLACARILLRAFMR